MGACINFSNHIWIGKETRHSGSLHKIGYSEIDDSFLKEIVLQSQIKTVQIEESLPMEAYLIIDRILEVRSDICFRIYGLYGAKTLDLSFLHTKLKAIYLIDTGIDVKNLPKSLQSKIHNWDDR